MMILDRRPHYGYWLLPSRSGGRGIFNEFLEQLRLKLLAAGPLDGVYICQHGAAVATHTHDPDGIMFDLVRRVVGDETPIVVTLDLHANISNS